MDRGYKDYGQADFVKNAIRPDPISPGWWTVVAETFDIRSAEWIFAEERVDISC